MGLLAALKGTWEKKAGRGTIIGKMGGAKRSNYSSTTLTGGTSTSKRPDLCQWLSSHFLRLRETFIQTKGDTYLIATNGWDAKK